LLVTQNIYRLYHGTQQKPAVAPTKRLSQMTANGTCKAIYPSWTAISLSSDDQISFYAHDNFGSSKRVAA
jgi:hypothetical protein